MNGFLLVITLLAVAVAAGASYLAWRVIAENRRRSEARIERLAEVIRAGERGEAAAVEMPHLLEPHEDTAPRRLVPLAAVGLGVVVLAAAVGFARTAADGPPGAPSGQPNARPASVATVDLIALTHERTGAGTLELRGDVRVPASRAMMEGMTAVALLFDSQGAYLSSSRAPLSARASDPTRASFFITVPDASRVARYRVSFRNGERLVPHVDRRGAQESGS